MRTRRPLVRGLLRVLLLEDSEADADLVADELDRAALRVDILRVDSRDEFVRALRDFRPDIILSDHSLGQFDARGALKAVRAARSTAPVVVVTGALDEQTAVTCLRAGAEDIVLKSNLRRLGPAIENALQIRRKLKKLSPRQYEVLCLVAQGLTTPAIADRLDLSVKTVETHRTAIMKRLGIHDLVGLVQYCVRRGLVPSEG
jgi:DNA-binding NarL/FixJ family response regulator